MPSKFELIVNEERDKHLFLHHKNQTDSNRSAYIMRQLSANDMLLEDIKNLQQFNEEDIDKIGFAILDNLSEETYPLLAWYINHLPKTGHKKIIDTTLDKIEKEQHMFPKEGLLEVFLEIAKKDYSLTAKHIDLFTKKFFKYYDYFVNKNSDKIDSKLLLKVAAYGYKNKHILGLNPFQMCRVINIFSKIHYNDIPVKDFEKYINHHIIEEKSGFFKNFTPDGTIKEKENFIIALLNNPCLSLDMQKELFNFNDISIDNFSKINNSKLSKEIFNEIYGMIAGDLFDLSNVKNISKIEKTSEIFINVSKNINYIPSSITNEVSAKAVDFIKTCVEKENMSPPECISDVLSVILRKNCNPITVVHIADAMGYSLATDIRLIKELSDTGNVCQCVVEKLMDSYFEEIGKYNVFSAPRQSNICNIFSECVKSFRMPDKFYNKIYSMLPEKTSPLQQVSNSALWQLVENIIFSPATPIHISEQFAEKTVITNNPDNKLKHIISKHLNQHNGSFIDVERLYKILTPREDVGNLQSIRKIEEMKTNTHYKYYHLVNSLNDFLKNNNKTYEFGVLCDKISKQFATDPLNDNTPDKKLPDKILENTELFSKTNKMLEECDYSINTFFKKYYPETYKSHLISEVCTYDNGKYNAWTDGYGKMHVEIDAVPIFEKAFDKMETILKTQDIIDFKKEKENIERR